MRFMEIDAIDTGLQPHSKERIKRFIDVGLIDEIMYYRPRTEEIDGEEVSIPQARLVKHFGAMHPSSGSSQFTAGYFLVDGTAGEWAAKIEAHQVAAPPSVMRIGHVAALKNTQVSAFAVADIDYYNAIEFIGKAGADVGGAFVKPDHQSARVAVSEIPINSDPSAVPFYSLTIPDVGTIRVSRSADGGKLYLLGDAGAAAFSLTIRGVMTA